MRVNKNREEGAFFEDLVKKRAQSQGLFVKKQYITARPGFNGRLIPVASELDFILCNQSGQVGFFDTKTFANDHFTYSDIKEHQIKTSANWNWWNVPSGLIVWFRGSNRICYYRGAVIETRGPGSRFGLAEAVVLGTWDNFDLKGLLAS